MKKFVGPLYLGALCVLATDVAAHQGVAQENVRLVSSRPAPIDRYRLDRWNKSGVAVERLQRDPDWFQPWGPGPPQLTAPTNMAIHQDSSGLLWVAVGVPKPGWRLSVPTRGPEVRRPDPAELVVNLVTRLEVIAPGQVRLLVSSLLDRFVVGFLGGGQAYGFQRAPGGLLAIGSG